MLGQTRAFIHNDRELCIDIQNHFYFVRIKQNDVAPELPCYIKKVMVVESNCTLFLEGKMSEVEWQVTYKKSGVAMRVDAP